MGHGRFEVSAAVPVLFVHTTKVLKYMYPKSPYYPKDHKLALNGQIREARNTGIFEFLHLFLATPSSYRVLRNAMKF